jgi:hypothetical protein
MVSVNEASTIYGLVSKLIGSELHAVIHNTHIGCLDRQYTKRHGYSPMLRMRVNRVTMIFGFVCMIIGKQFARSYA